MKIFTYKQYIQCIHKLRLNAVLQLAEEGEEYVLENQLKKNSTSEVIKHVLENTEEVQKFVNGFLKPKTEVNLNDIEKFKSNYITKKYKAKESGLIYKIKDVYFLIEHQTIISSSVRYKVLNHCIDIMQECCKNKRNLENGSYPIVVPTVIYTGVPISENHKKIKEKKISDCVFERYKIDLDYNLIDVNKISQNTLVEQDTMFGYMMLLQKSKNKLELIDNVELIIDSIKTKEKLKKLEELLDNCLEESIKKEIIEKILDRKNLHINYKKLLTNRTNDVIFTYKEETRYGN